jgi:hypothetical protein
MPLNSDDFEFVEVDEFINVNGKQVPSKGVRLMHKTEKKNFGEYYQVQVRSIEWQAAAIVHDKYRRKNDLGHEDLVSLRKFAENVVEQRKSVGKSINKDFLVQQVSAELKKRIAEKPKENLWP